MQPCNLATLGGLLHFGRILGGGLLPFGDIPGGGLLPVGDILGGLRLACLHATVQPCLAGWPFTLRRHSGWRPTALGQLPFGDILGEAARPNPGGGCAAQSWGGSAAQSWGRLRGPILKSDNIINDKKDYTNNNNNNNN